MRACSRFVAVSVLLLAALAHAQPLNEARVKAKLAYNMARFTEWPANILATPADPLLLCVLQRSDTVAIAFAELEGLIAAGHPVRVVLDPQNKLKECHVVFMHESVDNSTVAAALKDLAGSPVLTVGDVERFSDHGGMIELINVNDSVRFNVNLKELRGAQLALSSRVLKLARRIED